MVQNRMYVEKKSVGGNISQGSLTYDYKDVEDLLITAADNLNGVTATIKTVFPESKTQIYLVHQIRNACKYVVWKDKKQFTKDMEHIYDAPTKQAAETALKDFAQKWESKYSYAIKSWEDHRDELTVFF